MTTPEMGLPEDMVLTDELASEPTGGGSGGGSPSGGGGSPSGGGSSGGGMPSSEAQGPDTPPTLDLRESAGAGRGPMGYACGAGGAREASAPVSGGGQGLSGSMQPAAEAGGQNLLGMGLAAASPFLALLGKNKKKDQ
jgi:hypothetical protein